MTARPGSTRTGTGRARPLALIADDLAENRRWLGEIVASEGFDIIEAGDGEEAVRLARKRSPNLILLDIVMPRGGGMLALERLREDCPRVPVVVVTASDEPGISARALELGAVNFVRRPFDPDEVTFVVGRVRDALAEEQALRRALALIRRRQTVLEMPSDVELIHSVVAYLGHDLCCHLPDRELRITEIKLALYEALGNAIEHGNLEISWEEKSRAMERAALGELIARRRAMKRYRDRTVEVEVRYQPGRVVYRVRDQGPGFDWAEVERKRRLGPVTALHGRGLLLIRHYVDAVGWNAIGNEIRLTVRIPSRDPES